MRWLELAIGRYGRNIGSQGWKPPCEVGNRRGILTARAAEPCESGPRWSANFWTFCPQVRLVTHRLLDKLTTSAVRRELLDKLTTSGDCQEHDVEGPATSGQIVHRCLGPRTSGQNVHKCLGRQQLGVEGLLTSGQNVHKCRLTTARRERTGQRLSVFDVHAFKAVRRSGVIRRPG
jgi:hypothetical protein